MNILGLDLALTNCGVAVIGEGPTVLYTEVIHLPSRRTNEDRALWNIRRFQSLGDKLRKVVARFGTLVVAYEYPDRPFRAHWNRQRATPGSEFNAAQGLGLAEGFLCGVMAAIRQSYPMIQVQAVTIAEAKQHMTGNANARKDSVRRFLEMRYGWRLDGRTDDECDAISVAMVVADPEGLGPLLQGSR